MDYCEFVIEKCELRASLLALSRPGHPSGELEPVKHGAVHALMMESCDAETDLDLCDVPRWFLSQW